MTRIFGSVSPAPRSEGTACLNVVHVVPTVGIGGVERWLLSMAAYASKDRYRHSIAVLNSGPRLYDEEFDRLGVPRHSLGWVRRGKVDVGVVARLRRLLRDEDVHIVHAHTISAKVYAQLARIPFRAPAVIFHQHRVPTRLQRRLRHLTALLGEPDMTIAVSDAVREAAIAQARARASRVVTIHNGIPLPPATERGVPSAGARILGVGRLSPEKGFRFLIQAMTFVRAAVPAARLLIAGDGVERVQLQSLARALGLEDVVTFSGFESRPEKLFREHDLFVLPSVEEGLGLVILEAMAYGAPVVATAVGGVPEIVRHGENGLLVPPRDPEALGRALAAMLRNSSMRSALRTAGLATASRFDVTHTVRRLEEVYAGVARVRLDLVFDRAAQRWRRPMLERFTAPSQTPAR